MKNAEVARLLLSVVSPRWEAQLPGGWDSVDYGKLKALMQVEQCELWVYRRLKQLNAIPNLLPDFAEWLAVRARRATALNRLIDSARDNAVRHLTEFGCPHVVLKGSARRLLVDELPMIDARGSIDVDILVPGDQLETAWRHLQSLGYTQTPPPPGRAQQHATLHFIPLQDETGIPVELHHSTQSGLDDAIAWPRLNNLSRRVPSPDGVTVTIPSNTELFWHGMHHSIHQKSVAFKLRFLLDAVAMLPAGDIDFADIDSRVAAGETHNVTVARKWLKAARDLAAGEFVVAADRYDLVRTLAWHLHVTGTPVFGKRVADRAAEEGRRVEMGLGPVREVPGANLPLRLRRKMVSAVVRGAYRVLG